MMRPLCIDLFCGLGGWSQAFLDCGYWCVGFDIERHDYGSGGYPGELVLQDILTLQGSQFKDASIIVASPPCQAYSYRAMPWKRAKALPPPDNSLFEACFRIQREACEAAGRYIPLVVENVVGAQKWVGRARWHYGSFYLWGDVPALMPIEPYSKNNGGSGWFAIGNAKNKHNPDGRSYTRNPTPNGMTQTTTEDALKNASVGGGSWWGIFKSPASFGFEGNRKIACGSKIFDGYGGSFGWDKSLMRQRNL